MSRAPSAETVAGRALYVDANGVRYVGRGYRILRSEDGGRSWQLDAVIPAPAWRRAAATPTLGARLLRHYVAALVVLGDGTRVAVGRDGVYRAEAGSTRMRRVFRVTRGSRPLNLGVDARGRVLFGEYGFGLETEEVQVLASDDGARTFHVAHTFPRGDILHVHNVVPDPDGSSWVLCGDLERQPGIGRLSPDGRNFDWLARGDQQVRAVAMFVTADALVYGTDSDRDHNYIVRMDKASGRVDRLCEVEGSSLYACRSGATALIATCVEPNQVRASKFAGLYVSDDLSQWSLARRFEKDRWHPTLFQFGTLVLPNGPGKDGAGMFSGQALVGLDDRTVLLGAQGAGASLRAEGRA